MKINLAGDGSNMEILNKIVSNNIKIYRKQKKLSQLDIATSIGMTSPSFFSNAESNRNNKYFNLEHIYLISKILEVDIHKIIPNSNEIERTILNNSNKVLCFE